MNIVAIVAIALGLAMAAVGFAWYGPWSLPAVLGGIVLACVGALWLCAVAADKGIKDYIDYAKKGK